MTSLLPAQCFACTRLAAEFAPGTGTRIAGRCDAYPQGIPSDILMGADHRQPRGDEVDELTFSQAETAKALDAFDWWQKTFGA